MDHAQSIAAPVSAARPLPGAGALRFVMIAVVSFLTLVDLFATQAILPTLAAHYRVAPAAMGVAVNASTFGMVIAGIAVALLSRHIARREGVSLALALLAIPTVSLAFAPDLATFTVLRVVQGLCMSAAFTLTMAYLAESTSASEIGGMLAAYITGNVASNFVGRLVSASIADTWGLDSNFLAFAGLNLIGAAIAYAGLTRCTAMGMGTSAGGSSLAAWAGHFRNPPLVAAFAIGFMILFAFIGTFTYVNFVLVAEPLSLSPMALGLVYFVFLPSMLTTPLAGTASRRFGARPTFWSSLGVAALGLPLLVTASLPLVLAGLALVAAGTFFAQAAATGFVGRAAMSDRGSASGIYLASYYAGGLAGAAVLGRVFDGAGWTATVFAIAASIAAAALLATALKPAAMAPGPVAVAPGAVDRRRASED